MEKTREAEEVNDLLRAKSSVHDFVLINNDNITRSHIYVDNCHLNDGGLEIMANNFINAINSVR